MMLLVGAGFGLKSKMTVKIQPKFAASDSKNFPPPFLSFFLSLGYYYYQQIFLIIIPFWNLGLTATASLMLDDMDMHYLPRHAEYFNLKLHLGSVQSNNN